MNTSTGSTKPPPHDLFSNYYQQHYSRILAYTRRRLPEEAARDATAEVFTTAWRRWDKAEPGALPWLYATAAHVVATSHRSTQRRTALLDRASAEPTAHAVPDHAEGHADRTRVLAAVRQLPERDRELLLLTIWEELDVATAAHIVGTSVGAAHVRLHRARRRLRLLLALEPPDARAAADGDEATRRCPPLPSAAPTPTPNATPTAPALPNKYRPLDQRSTQEVRP